VELLCHRFKLDVKKVMHKHLAEHGLDGALNIAKLLQGGCMPGVSNDKAILDNILEGGALFSRTYITRRSTRNSLKIQHLVFLLHDSYFMRDLFDRGDWEVFQEPV
jgi:hypothetical protein